MDEFDEIVELLLLKLGVAEGVEVGLETDEVVGLQVAFDIPQNLFGVWLFLQFLSQHIIIQYKSWK